MIHKNNTFRLTAIFLLLFLTISYTAQSQEKSKLVVYENVGQMVADAKKVITEVTPENFKKTYTRKDIFIVDVRTAAENQAGAVPGAVNIPRGMLEFRIGLEEVWETAGKKPPQKTDPIFVYCSTGGRGSLSAKALMQLGYTNVQSLQGGWNAWSETYPDIKE
ncbi:MAG TPA: rhodanese-like domain-containing protein [Mariniphaga anaerophila]|uniref:Rhodanese-like domain-containing protein n=1 Tax=Mariniphaga anaerophila TaxID=1484053 RepID=A0A831PIP3_9BACT|nr:rhodanese-like domain-containing protein [Mariniphaga anaerophila]